VKQWWGSCWPRAAVWETEIQPHGVADDLGGKSMALVAGASGGRHSTRLPISVSQRNPAGHAKLTVPLRLRGTSDEPALDLRESASG